LGTWDAQTAFIAGSVGQHLVQRKYTKSKNSRRSYTRKYSILGNKVCQQAFLNTFAISSKRVKTALTKKDDGSLTNQRGRGKAWDKITHETKQAIIKHINSFPHYVSHYCHAKSSSK